MDENRKKVIVAEIENWRKNHLLPEHYCVFLLNLYTEGDRQAPLPSKNGVSSNSRAFASGSTDGLSTAKSGFFGGGGSSQGYSSGITNASISGKMVLYWFLGASLIAALILLAFHFNGFSTSMQIAIFAVFSLIFYILAFVFKNKAPVLTHVALLFFFVLLILGGFFFIQKFDFPRSTMLMYLAIISILWCLNGIIFSFSYLLYCGILGLGMLYGYFMVEQLNDQYSWWRTELYWVPLSLLLIGSGFLLHNRNQRLAGVLAICGMVYFFGSEISSLYIKEAKHDIIQLVLFIKVFASSALFFFTRQYWFSWLRL